MLKIVLLFTLSAIATPFCEEIPDSAALFSQETESPIPVTEPAKESAVPEAEPEVPPRGGIGTIFIETTPPGSDIYLDGESLGKSPVRQEFRSGRFDLVIMEKGIQLKTVRFNVWPGQVNTFAASTTLPYGTLVVETNVPFCQIFTNGQFTENMNDPGKLNIKRMDAGEYAIKAVCGAKQMTKMVTLQPEGSTTVKFEFEVPKPENNADTPKNKGAESKKEKKNLIQKNRMKS